ncbi:lytic transglycosylase domain-containing protein [Rhodoferax sp.]|uniref:lytic transglycosylase domain-containing protein n=1 Tax=Rhodoferax sp. TaxID=50421 RepID=UPI0019E1DF97|nr:lytic transglycosylase domain-containing protein [Rhodoferax sp.]MBE0473872.1 lytic transglycosylase domain-containing protein [Rhodoferax sp.]
MQFRTILTLIALLGSLCGVPALAQSAASGVSASDAVILEMRDAFNKGLSERLTELLPRAQGHVLAPWAAYWELRARMDTATPEEIDSFLNRFAGTYQEDRLRNDWLLLLGKDRDWSRFVLEASKFRMQDDREVRCYTLAMEHILAKVDMSQEAQSLWLAQRNNDEGCSFAVQTYLDSQLLSDQAVWQKVRSSLELRRVSAARQAFDMVAPQASAQWTALISKPEQFLTRTTLSNQRQTQELVVLALIRLAQTEPQRAAELLASRWQQHLHPNQRDWAWAAIGAQAAQKLSDDALDFFANGRPSAMQDAQLAWYARAALRQNDWMRVLNAIEAMTPDAALDATWVYWRARAMLALAPTQAMRQRARQLLQSVAGVQGFYELLALEELGLPITPPPLPEPLTAAEKAKARTNPGLQRALAAIAIGMRSEGVREWNYSANLHTPGGMNDRELLAAADLACQHEVWDRCINTSERTKNVIDLTQRFPMPHKQAVLARTREIGLDPAYVYGLIRQESRFIMDARSGVGASGLMQVMPATARWTAKKIGLTSFKPHQITERDTNIAIGTGYLKLVLDDFAGSMPMAAAAYNAGPGRPRAWRGQTGAPVLEAAIWAENVPFNETRDYVKKVLANTTIYAAMISGHTQSLKARLGEVGPPDGALVLNRDLP